jgi:CBS domain-containing protein
MEILEVINNDKFTTELAKFNIEANLDPRELTGKCFSALENEIHESLRDLSKSAKKIGVDYVLTGILPTIRKFDLELENLTPLKRYDALMKAISKLRGEIHELKIDGIDELNITHDSPMLESCNTSFQVHLQVHPQDFVTKYNAAQALAAPVLAISSNSPLLFGKRLWHETRVALFQQSIDTRVVGEHLRDRSPRVTFGNRWLQNSILDLYKEDIVRFRVMLMTDVETDVLKQLKDGEVPQLRALTIHNSTVYRWNRPCYGISPDGRPHLRIENRVFPSGPTPIDEVANSAFWLGLMTRFDEEYPDFTKLMHFDDIKTNFTSASFGGIDTKLHWVGRQKITTSELINKELIPIAKEGLISKGVDSKEIDHYLDVIKERAESRQTGTNWMLGSFQKLAGNVNRDQITTAITYSMVAQQKANKPVHLWEKASIEDILEWHPSSILVEEFMTTDLFTVHKHDILELVADIMEWQKLRYIPVEDEKGKLTGLITSRMLLKHFAKNKDSNSTTVQDLMIKDPIVITPESNIYEAMSILKKEGIGCLPVVKNKKLVGVVTENNFLNITESLLNMITRNT